MRMIPDKLPASSREPTDEMKRARALTSVRVNLVAALRRLDSFLVDKENDSEVIKHLHTGKTEIKNDSDDPEIVTYYSLWTDFGDMRITRDGLLLRSDYYEEKYSDVKQYGADKSKVVSMYDLRLNYGTYKTVHLLSLANQLEKFLKPKEDSPDS